MLRSTLGFFIAFTLSACGGGGGAALVQPTDPGSSQLSAPAIVSQPADFTTLEGNSATFSVTANGTAPLTFQWQRNGADLPGATSSSLTLATVQLLDHLATYGVRISNAAGGVSSKFAKLIVQPAMGNTLVKLAGSFTVDPVHAPFTTPVDGVGADARFASITGLAADRQGNVYAVEEVGAIRKISPSGAVTTIAGSLAGSSIAQGGAGYVDGPGSTARFQKPQAIAVQDDGTLYVADRYNYAVRKVSPQGIVSTLTGDPNRKSQIDGPTAQAGFTAPIGLALDAAGNLYVLDGNETGCLDDQVVGAVPYFKILVVRKISLTGQVTTLTGTTATAPADKVLLPGGIAVDASGNVYMSVTQSRAPTAVLGVGCGSFRNASDAAFIQKVSPSGQATVIAGSTTAAGAVDGPAAMARFQWPAHIALDRFGALFIADADNHAVRRLDPSGVVTTPIGQLSTTPAQALSLGPLPGQLVYTSTVAVGLDDAVILGAGTWQGTVILRTERRP